MLEQARLQVAYRFHRHIKKTDGNYAYLGNGWRKGDLGSRCARACSRRDVYGALYFAIDMLAWRGSVDIKVLSPTGQVLVATDFNNTRILYSNKLSWWQRVRFRLSWDELKYLLIVESQTLQRVDSYKASWRSYEASKSLR